MGGNKNQQTWNNGQWGDTLCLFNSLLWKPWPVNIDDKHDFPILGLLGLLVLKCINVYQPY
jgi:hypothetical protein